MKSQHHIDASFDTLFEQAIKTARSFTRMALRETEDLPMSVDRTAVVVAFINAASTDWRASSLAIGHQKIAAAIEELELRFREE